MNKNVSKAIGDDQEKRGKSRYTRLLAEDDEIVMERTNAPSTLIADLVHKGLAYESLAKGADDPAIRTDVSIRRARRVRRRFSTDSPNLS
jgi:hypothetical protein